MNDLRKAAEMALEALENVVKSHKYEGGTPIKAIQSLRQALAQPEQKPPPWWTTVEKILEEYGLQAIDFVADFKKAMGQPEQEPVAWMVYSLDGQSVCVTDNPQDFTDQHRALPLWTRPFELREKQEPVAWRHWFTADGEKFPKLSQYPITDQDEPLYVAPPKREWVGLTDEDMREVRNEGFDLLYGARWAERKLKEKNA